MKILHVLTAPRAEGTPRLVLDWLTVKSIEHEVVFLASEGELKSAFLDTGVWQYYNEAFRVKFINGFKIVRLIKRIARQRKPDVLISWPTGTSQWIHTGARLAGVRKLIVHAGNPPGKTFMRKYIATYFSFWTGYLLGNKVIACSAYIKNEFLKIPFLASRQFHWVHNCFNPAKFNHSGIGKSREVIMVATFEAHKDHETLLRAWKIIEDLGTNLPLKLAGSGSLHEGLTRLATELGLKQVAFLGSRDDIPRLLGSSKVFVLSTTEQEGFGTVLIEGLASGCLVVASDVPACREALCEGKYGLLVEAGNPQKLAEAILNSTGKELSVEDHAERLLYVQQFTPENMVRKYLNIVNT